jgi:signal transduction histidine kinase
VPGNASGKWAVMASSIPGDFPSSRGQFLGPQIARSLLEGGYLNTRQKPSALTYGLAILAVLAAIGMRILWKPLLENESPFLFFFAALAFASWFGGMGPGFLAAFLGAFSVALLGLLPVTEAGSIAYLHLLQYGVFMATGMMISFLMGRLHAAIQRSGRIEQELEQRVQERTEQLLEVNRSLQKISSELISAQETERLRISKELHDELGQSLTLVKLKIGLVDAKVQEDALVAKKYCQDASDHVDQAIENMRRLSRDLSPVMVDTLGITIALRHLVDQFNVSGGIRIAADIAPIDDLLLLAPAIMLYRIVQEALNNIVKHSGANTANVNISKANGEVSVDVKDSGRGLGAGNRERTPDSGGLGLDIMRERVRTLGGTLEIESREGSGTILRFAFPAKKGNGAYFNNSQISTPGAGI